jgi:hypothetical protein
MEMENALIRVDLRSREELRIVGGAEIEGVALNNREVFFFRHFPAGSQLLKIQVNDSTVSEVGSVNGTFVRRVVAGVPPDPFLYFVGGRRWGRGLGRIHGVSGKLEQLDDKGPDPQGRSDPQPAIAVDSTHFYWTDDTSIYAMSLTNFPKVSGAGSVEALVEKGLVKRLTNQEQGATELQVDDEALYWVNRKREVKVLVKSWVAPGP